MNDSVENGRVSPHNVELKDFKKVGDGADQTNGDVKTKKSKKVKEVATMVGVFELFKFSDVKDRLLIALGAFMSVCNGVAMPSMIIIFGQMINEFVVAYQSTQLISSTMTNSTLSEKAGVTKLLVNMRYFALIMVGLGFAVWIVSYGQMACWGISAERQARRIRFSLYNNILRMHMGWFDTHNAGELNTRMTDDVNKIKEGFGDKIGQFLQYSSMCITGFIIGFVYGWKLTLVILSVSPLMALGAFMMTQLLATLTSGELKAYAEAGAVAEEVLGSIRTVTAFGGQFLETNRYSSKLHSAMKQGIKKSLFNGLGIGFVWFVMLGSYALAFWYGATLVRDEPETYNEGVVLIVFFSVIFGAFSLGTAAPHFQSLAVARGAAYSVYEIIDMKSEINSFSEEGLKPSVVTGNIVFSDVYFNYPSRSDVQVLNGINLQINVGQRIALVGPSGCGKSTVIQLIQRFYNPLKGKVTFDGVDIKELNVQWLREKIGVVSQEPVLFDTTIAENLRFGRLDVTNDEMEEATKQANAHQFIMDLPDKYETRVGEGGAQLSGGQKQRIAIARALIRNPVLLLLDEATSALDNESEAVVQEALDKASMGRTTLVIAHRLSTVHGADRIVAIKDGAVVEEGTHSELIEKDGLYKQLVNSQMTADEEDFDEINLKSEEAADHRQLKQMTSITSVGSDQEKANIKEEVKVEEKPKVDMKRIMKYNSPEALFIAVGVLSALINGGVQPAFAVILSKALFSFNKPEEMVKFSIGFIGLAVLCFITFFLQGYMNGISGERLTKRLRNLSFKAMIHQDMAWFDDPANNTGALCTRLSVDASQVQGATGSRLGVITQQLGTMVASIILSFVYEWGMTLVILAFVPFIAASGYLQMMIMSGSSLSNKKQLEDVGKIAVESIENIRTIASLTREKWFFNEYVARFDGPYRASLKKAHMVGIAFGFSQGILFFIYAACFYFGAWRVERGQATGIDIMIVFMAIVFGAMAAGQASSFAPDYTKAVVSADCILKLLDSVPKINADSDEGLTPDSNKVTSSVNFNGVKFEYPTREFVKVLRGLNLDVNPGETIALVGSSGCGKSTVVSLIERFYDVREGSVNLSGFELPTLNVKWLRSQIGIVSQEPVLFDRSIRDNIAYGDSSRDVPFDEIIAAARNANIHSFIDSLPMKYDTNVGSKGTQLSGGQKQRVAIARALIRNPKILLLDEATSALDTESEKVVQEALDKASEGRTCIVIAHRLATITNADRIFVIRRGVVTESGNHSQLMANKKFYYNLHLTQMT